MNEYMKNAIEILGQSLILGIFLRILQKIGSCV